MTLQEFDTALLTWGSDLENWPAGARAEARSLLETDPQAQLLLDEMTLFNAELGAAMAVGTSDGAIAAKTQAALQQRRDTVGLWSLLPLRKILGFGSLAGVGGAAMAFVAPSAVNTGALLAIALGGGAL
ncbi:MAG: hypothetical protein AAGL24_28375 [Pseudomonadota bacterium]